MPMAKAAFSLLCALAVLAVSVSLDAEAPAPSADANFGDAVWLATPYSALKIDSSKSTVESIFDGETDLRVIDVDYRLGAVWAYGGGTLSKLDFNGAPIFSVPVELETGSADQHVDLAVDSTNALVWLAVKRQLFVFDSSGWLIETYPLEQDVQAISLDPQRQQAWVATERLITVFDAFIRPVENIDIDHSDRLVDLAFDSDRGQLWFVTEKDVLQRVGRDSLQPELVQNAPAKSRRIVIDFAGGLWIATDNALVHLDPSGSEDARVELPSNKPPVDLVASMADGSAWVATTDGIRNVAVDGEILATLEMASNRHEDQIQDLANYADVIPPLISVHAPTDGSFIADNTPSVELSYSDIGTGVDTATLTISVDGQPQQAGCDFHADHGVCELIAVLTEGEHVLKASVSDFKGNRSTKASVTFMVDTIPPLPLDATLLNVGNPVNGAVSLEASAGAAEALALVRVKNSRSGEVVPPFLSASDGSFSTAIRAQQGDSLAFTVIDNAGNVSAETLVSVAGLVLTIESPTDDSTVDGRFIQVRGTIEGPENTGVAVNGVVALIDGENYVADQVPLVAGENTIRVTARTLSGASASEEIRVFSNGQAPLLRLSSSVRSGITPLTVVFRVEFFVEQRVVITLQDFNGDGEEDRIFGRPGFGGLGGLGGPKLTNPNPFEVTQTFSEPGTYTAQIEVNLEDGTELSDEVTIQVLDPAVFDARLLALWDGVFDAIVANNVEAALQLMTPAGKKKYRRVFEGLAADMETIIQDFSRPERMSASSSIGEYAVVRLENGRRQIFLVYFVKGTDGVWRLDTM